MADLGGFCPFVVPAGARVGAARGVRRARFAASSEYERRGRDSNPRRTEMARNGFRDRRIQPLCHPSEMDLETG
jgi:hypothetical protein